MVEVEIEVGVEDRLGFIQGAVGRPMGYARLDQPVFALSPFSYESRSRPCCNPHMHLCADPMPITWLSSPWSRQSRRGQCTRHPLSPASDPLGVPISSSPDSPRSVPLMVSGLPMQTCCWLHLPPLVRQPIGPLIASQTGGGGWRLHVATHAPLEVRSRYLLVGRQCVV